MTMTPVWDGGDDPETVPETDVSEGTLVMPFYIICDVSGSMKDDLPQLQRDLTTLVDQIGSDPVVNDITMISIIAFGTTARTLVSLSDAAHVTVPTLTLLGATNFSAAINEYADAYEADYARLKQQGKLIFRPCVFFLTDGQATDPGRWEQAFDQRIVNAPATSDGKRRFPYIVAYGFRQADRDQLRKLAYPNFGEKKGTWFHSHTNQVTDLLTSMVGAIGKSILASGRSATTGQPEFQPPPLVNDGKTTSGHPDIF
jgi:uncharacterized protein YegL